jgi:CRISPR-associated endonuclease/helicase Cas3
MTFDELFQTATGNPEPYEYQRRIASDGFPEVLAVPTGAGKTAAAVLPWLYRRRYASDEVRSTTARWLVVVLPMRVLVEQTVDNVKQWLVNLGLASEVPVFTLMGGEPRDSDLRMRCEGDAVVVGTLDMVVSRSLNRGYGESRFVWPIDFGLFNNGCHFVFDEVQLMGPALATTRQLHGLRSKLGTALACSSTWMSATVDDDALRTVDAPTIASVVELSDADRSGLLRKRLDATKTIVEVPVGEDRARDLADFIAREHHPGTLTLAIVNTIKTARAVHGYLTKAGSVPQPVLLHSQFRPGDRSERVHEVLQPTDPSGPGRIVVSTQVVEAGVDISAQLLVTEAAPWPSIVQRAGRCNRDGEARGARLAWASVPEKAVAPYEPADVAASSAALAQLEQTAVTSASLRELRVATTRPITPVLRRKDLIELFDTAPDLDGNDIAVDRFIRNADDLDVAIAWRHLPDNGPASGDPIPSRDERCPAPVGDVKKLAKDRPVYRFDHLQAAWVRASTQDIRPGGVFVVDVSFGRYSSTAGWDPAAATPVEPVLTEESVADADVALGSDPLTFDQPVWLLLDQHLADVEFEATSLVDALKPDSLTTAQISAAVLAGRWHDIGKAHPSFQALLRKGGWPEGTPPPDGPLAKSLANEPAQIGSSGGHSEVDHADPIPVRPYFRHELASLLALLGEGAVALEGVEERDLVCYLVASHHGRVRLGCRPHPRESTNGPGLMLGIRDGDELPGVQLRWGALPSSTLLLGPMGLGGVERSWTARAVDLRDRADLGPFRLGFLEAIVRLADWRASAAPGQAPEWSDHA